MADLVENILAADARIKTIDGGPRETPLDLAGPFSEQTGAQVVLKGEHLQPTGSFKLRGAMNKMLSLNDDQRAQGVITASSGNHGMATTLAASLAGVTATVYLPESVSSLKRTNIERMGAKTVLVPGAGVECERAGRRAAADQGVTFVSPYSDLDIIAGQGTIGAELERQCPDLAAVYVCVGGGGLISGIGSYLKVKRPGVDIVGCWPANATAMHGCIEKGEIWDVPETDTLSDGSAGGIEEGAITFPICQQVIDRHVMVAEEEIAEAMRETAAKERYIIEGAAGVAVAAALKTGGDYAGKPVATIICGRNVSMEVFMGVMAGAKT
ncbi:MAG: threonine/serine dehydratase [Pseudomonadota bacterium]